MNYYFLLEDEKSFIKVLPEWLKYMGIQNTRVQDITYVRENNYVMQCKFRFIGSPIPLATDQCFRL